MVHHAIAHLEARVVIPGHHSDHFRESLWTGRKLWNPVVGVGAADVLTDGAICEVLSAPISFCAFECIKMSSSRISLLTPTHFLRH
jgi:hypothetical protein